MAIHDIELGRLSACALLLLVVVMLSRAMGLGLEGRLVVAASRCAVQLSLLSAFILAPMFSTNRPEYIFPYLAFILVLAAREASSRLTYVYRRVRWHFLVAFTAGAGSVVAFAAAVVLQLSPWWDAQYLVPVSGMALGNQLTATAIGLESFLSDLAEGTDRVQLRLCRGARWTEAALPSARKALVAALTPTLNSMSVMGLVMIPGMMTGQLLGGQAPLEAGMYQVMIMYLVTVAGCVASTGVVGLAATTVFDTREHAFARDEIRRVATGGPKRDVLAASVVAVVDAASAAVRACRLRGAAYARLLASDDDARELAVLATNDPESGERAPAGPTTRAKRFYAVADDPAGTRRREAGEIVVFRAEEIVVERTRLQVSFALAAGTVTSLSGPSGSGKSTTLKVLARIEPRGAGELVLAGEPTAKIDAPTWRTRVVYVSQDRPTLVGTPREFYHTLRAYRTQRRRRHLYADDEPLRIARAWGLAPEKFDQAWATLSGGEAQRASLALALALKPEVLLLDEPTSALDDATARLVEADLLASPAAILIATHSVEQATRLCRHHIRIHAQRERDRSAVFEPATAD